MAKQLKDPDNLSAKMLYMIKRKENAAFIELIQSRPDLLKMPVQGRSLMYVAAQQDNYELLEFLLKQTGDPNMSLEGGTDEGPISGAIDSQCVDAVRLLLSHGANTNLGRPFIDAIDMGSLEIVQILVEHGADMNIAYPWFGSKTEKYTPLSFALSTGADEIAEYLRANGAKLTEEVEVSPTAKTPRKKKRE